MKNIFCFLMISFAGILNVVQAQRFKAGISSGVSASQISGDTHGGFNKAGFTGGVFVKTDFDETYSGQFEINYIQKGARKNIQPNKNDYGFYLLRLNYIEVPVLAKYLHKQFIFEAGPTIAALISFLEENEHGEVPLPRDFNRYEVGFAVGMNYHFTDKLDMNWRFTNSALPVRKHISGATFRTNLGQYSSVLGFTLHYQFNR